MTSTTPNLGSDAPQGTPQDQQGQEPNNGTSSSPKVETFSAEYVAELRREVAGYRTRATKAETALTAAQAGVKTVEERLAEMEARAAESELRSLRAEVAAEFGISGAKGKKGEPSDVELFLTGSTEEILRAQAARISSTLAEKKANGAIVKAEGTNHQPVQDESIALVRALFKR